MFGVIEVQLEVRRFVNRKQLVYSMIHLPLNPKSANASNYRGQFVGIINTQRCKSEAAIIDTRTPLDFS